MLFEMDRCKKTYTVCLTNPCEDDLVCYLKWTAAKNLHSLLDKPDGKHTSYAL